MPSKPNILLLMTDEHTAGTLGCYGHPFVQTPAMDSLARDGVLFERAYCNSPICATSRHSFLSGRYTWRTNSWHNGSLPPTHLPSIASHLREHGYYTATMGKMHFVGPDQHWGFQHRPYGDFLGEGHQPDPISHAPRLPLLPVGPAEIPEAEMQESIVNRLGIEFLRNYNRNEPFCLMLSYNRPHHPLRPPQRFWEQYFPDHADMPDWGPNFPGRFHPYMEHQRKWYGFDKLSEQDFRAARAGYYACISFVDDKIAEVLRTVDELGLRDDTIIIYWSDHGEMNGEQGRVWKSNFFEPSVRVPFIVSYPKQFPRGKRVSELVELIDLFPTVADLVGTPLPEGLDGKSLSPLMTGDMAAHSKEFVFCDHVSHSVPAPQRMIRTDEWKFILYLDAQPSLYNLKEDPQEFHDRGGDPGTQSIRRDLEGLLRADWDEALVRENFVYSPSGEQAQGRPLYGTPNQYLTEGGQYVNAETFYGDVNWMDAAGKI